MLATLVVIALHAMFITVKDIGPFEFWRRMKEIEKVKTLLGLDSHAFVTLTVVIGFYTHANDKIRIHENRGRECY